MGGGCPSFPHIPKEDQFLKQSLSSRNVQIFITKVSEFDYLLQSFKMGSAGIDLIELTSILFNKKIVHFFYKFCWIVSVAFKRVSCTEKMPDRQDILEQAKNAFKKKEVTGQIDRAS